MTRPMLMPPSFRNAGLIRRLAKVRESTLDPLAPVVIAWP